MVNQSEVDGLENLIKDPKIRRILASAILHGLKTSKNAASNAYVSLISSFSGYEDYLKATHDKVATIKTFADPTKPVSLLDHFVDPTLTNGKSQKVDHYKLRELISKNSKIVISALAGFGKSVLMRYLALSFYENPEGKIPIFIELRDINRTKDPNLLSYIHATYKQNSNISNATFERALSQGVFAFFLDGFDEINFEHRDEIQKQIIELSNEYADCSVVVSSRPDPKFDSWEKFSTYSICPMSLPQVEKLINKIEYDPSLKKKFIGKLRSGLYEKHHSFLSTPLLATLMMLTFEQNANIPDKMHLFYLRAFETLFDKHDTYKEQYERKRRSGLRIDQLSNLFSFFCYNTYLEEEFEFSKIDIIRYLNDAISYCGYTISVEDLLFDLVESICLIQLEGHFYSFVHRSFQEYFTAVFLDQCPEDIRDEFLDESFFRPSESVLPMLFDMCQDRIEVDWILPRICKYESDLSSFKSKSLARRAFYMIWKEAKIRVDSSNQAHYAGFTPGEHRKFVNTLRAFYPEKLKLFNTHLFADEVDELFTNLCEIHGYKYIPVKSNIEIDKLEEIYISLHPIENYSIKSMLVKKIFDESKIILGIKEMISDRKVVKQSLLKRIKERRLN